jgi:hypothetical protein
MKQLLIISVLLFSVASCNKNKTKKDPLVGDKAFLIGTWNWDVTYDSYDFCDPGVDGIDTINAIGFSESFKIVFREEGVLEYYSDGVLTDERNISFSEFYQDVDYTSFDIFPDENEDLRHGCVWGDDRLAFSRYPFITESDGCHIYVNYFEKE